MTDVGIVGLDTSHAEGFADVIAEHTPATVAAVWDGGLVRDEAYREGFCEDYGARSYGEPAEMADDVDAALVLAVDWDSHRSLAVPFLERGVPTLIDKPVAGRVADVEALRAATDGTTLFGGSAVPYHPSIQSLSAADGSLYCVGYNDPFYYGSHLVDTVRRVVGEDWARVSPADDPGLVVDVAFEGESFATLRLDGPDEDGRFGFLGVGDRAAAVEVGSSRAEMDEMYRAYIDAFLDVVAGERETTHRVLDAAELGVAVQAALERDRPVTPDSEALADHHVDAEPFVREYSPYY